MQERKFSGGHYRHYLLLAFFGMLAFWPLTLHWFSLKNDAITYFLPFRYQISESVRHGHLPLWSPYIYTGLPLHADIQSGAWNPAVLLISIFTRYNMSVLEWECFFYIIVAGCGFLKLGRLFGFDKMICLVLASAYICSGLMIDSASFIPWITSAAWMPFVFLNFLRLTERPAIHNTIKLSLSTALLFLAGYSSFFIFTCYILFFASLVYCIRRFRKNERNALFIRQALLAMALTTLICSPALLSYLDFFPFYARGKTMDPAAAQVNPFHWKNLLSYIFPPASYKLNGGNDISSRNAYIGILPLIFLFYAFRYKMGLYQKSILFITVVCFLFSLGTATPVRALFYQALPLMDRFRHPGSFRLFTNMGLLLLSGFGLNEYFRSGRTRPTRIILACVLLVLVIICYYALFAGGLQGLKAARISSGVEGIKEFLDDSGLPVWLLIAGVIQLVFLLLLLVIRNQPQLLLFHAMNLLFFTWICMPFTMISKHRTAEVNAFIHSFPSGFPASEAWRPLTDDINDTSSLVTFGYKNFYQKRITIQDHIVTPTVNEAYGRFLADTQLRRDIVLHPFAYTSRDSLALVDFQPNEFTIRINGRTADTLHITQQYNRHWTATADQKPLVIEVDHIAFMKATLPSGVSEVRFTYRPATVIMCAFVSLLVILGCIGALVYFSRTGNE